MIIFFSFSFLKMLLLLLLFVFVFLLFEQAHEKSYMKEGCHELGQGFKLSAETVPGPTWLFDGLGVPG